MKNWPVDVKELKKDKRKYTVWKLEQMVNFGLDGKKQRRGIEKISARIAFG